MAQHANAKVEDGALQGALYSYSPLPRGDTFRYLILYPGDKHEVLRCSIQTSSISTTKYVAISYVWGMDTKDHDIICDGRLLRITKNLHNALARLRTSSPMNLWADSICIDQQNMTEKTHQLARMGRIYAEADRVMVCMGPDPGEHAPKVSSLLGHMRKWFNDEISKFEKIAYGLFPYPSREDPILEDSRWLSLEALLHQPWFQRGWCVRETGLAKECEVVWGNVTFSWADLIWVACWLYGRNVNIASLPSSYHPLSTHLDAYWDRHNEFERVFFHETPWSPNTLLDYLARGRCLQFRDRRDNIFAFLDLATDQDFQLSLNYDQSTYKVFYDFAAQYLQASGDTTLLEYIVHGDQLVETGLPSWVPNWDATATKLEYATHVTNDRYAWSALMPYHGTFRKPEIVSEGLLKVHGAIFDTVSNLTDVLRSATTTSQSIFDLWCYLRGHHFFTDYSEPFLAEVFVAALTQSSIMLSQRQWPSCKAAYVEELLNSKFQSETLQWSGSSERIRNLNLVQSQIVAQTHNMRLMITEHGHMGLAPSAAREGDICSIVFGSAYPCLLRISGAHTSYQFVGSAQVLYLSDREGSLDKRNLRNEPGLHGYSLCQDHEEDRKRWDIVEQDIYLC